MKRITKQSKITLVELPPTQFGEYNGDRGFCVFDRFGSMPSRSLHALEAIALNEGFQNTESLNPLFGAGGGIMTSDEEEKVYGSDVMGVSSITRTSSQSQELVRRFKLKNPNGITIAGGPDPTFRGQDWLKEGYADIVVIGEGEATFRDLLNRLEADTNDLSEIPGIAFRKNGHIQINERRNLLTPEELSRLPHPVYNKTVKGLINIPVMETIRGCPNDCNFCTVTQLYGRKYRMKSLDYALEGLRELKDVKGMSLFFTDDNFTASAKRTIELCDRIVKEGLNRGSCAQSTVGIAQNPLVLDALEKAGIKTLYVGLESINAKSLEGYDKPYTEKQNRDAIRTFAERGFWVHVMYMPGGEGDTPESLREDFEWLKGNVDSIQFMPPTPLPGTKLYDQMKAEGRILREDALYLYDVQHVVAIPRYFTPYQLQDTVNRMYEEFYSPREFARRMTRLKGLKKKLINTTLGLNLFSRDAIRKTLYGPQEREHLDFLKSLDKKTKSYK